MKKISLFWIAGKLKSRGKTPMIWNETDVSSYPYPATMYGLTPTVIAQSRERGYQVICTPVEYALYYGMDSNEAARLVKI